MNKVVLMGRLTNDPEVRYGQKTSVARFTIAVDRKIKTEGGPKTDFFYCSSFGKTAEFIEKYWKKGMKALITGRIENQSYEKDGQKRTSTNIMVEDIEFTEKKADNQTENNQPSGWATVPEGKDDELPFTF